MNKFSLLFAALQILICTNLIYGQNTDQKSVAVTVYNANLGVVKDIRTVDLKNGTSLISISDVAQFIDPTSVHIKLNGEVIEQNYQYDLVSLDKILQKYIDKEIQLIGENNEFIEGKLLSAYGGQIVLEKKEGGLVMLPNLSKYRLSVGELPEGLITKPTLVWMVNSNSSGKQDVEVSYQTSGMNWHAEYVAVLNDDDTELDLNSWVSVENSSGTTYNNAKLKLIAGDLNLVQDIYPQVGRQNDMVYMEKSTQPQFQEKEFFEYHIYNLERPTTISNNETKQISLFESADVGVVKKYYYKSGGYRTYYSNQGNTNKVNVVVEFENKTENNLGVPMPKGKVRVYKADENSLEFIGEDLIDHTPRNEKVKLKIGDAFDITVEEKQTENNRISDRVNEQAYEIKIKNHKKENITVEVERYLGLYWEILSSSHTYDKKDSQNITYKIPVSKDGETVLSFKVRYVY